MSLVMDDRVNVCLAAVKNGDMPIGVFADWLEERGDERGQIIRSLTIKQGWVRDNLGQPIPYWYVQGLIEGIEAFGSRSQCEHGLIRHVLALFDKATIASLLAECEEYEREQHGSDCRQCGASMSVSVTGRSPVEMREAGGYPAWRTMAVTILSKCYSCTQGFSCTKWRLVNE